MPTPMFTLTSEMAAQVLMKRGKRTLATQIKVECCRQNGQQLKELLDFLLAPSRQIDDFETLDWCRWLIAGGHTFDEFSKTVRQYDNAATCGLVWTANFVAYRCRTCGVSPCMSLCSDCFQAGNHVGHDYNMFRSQAGGACDCGDVSVMNPDGFCPRHGPDRVPKHTHCPDDLLAVAEVMLPKVFLRLVHHLRDNSKPEMMGTYQIVMQEAERFLAFLHSLSDMGAAMRKVITQALTDEGQYKTFTQVEEKEDGSNMYYVSSQNNYQTAVSMMKHPEGWRSMKRGWRSMKVRISMMKHPERLKEYEGSGQCGEHPERLEEYEERLKEYEGSGQCGEHPERLEEYEDVPGLSQHLQHNCLLDELVFWMVKYEFPQKIVTLLLSLLPDDRYKEAFTRSFVSHYSRISLVLVSANDRLSVANRVVHISVQLFSNELLSKKMADELNLVYILVLSLTRMIEYMLSDSCLQDPDHNFHMVVDCGQAAMKDHCYWPIVSDLINLLTHKSIAESFMLDERLIKLWLETVTYFQGMNLNQRELTQHVEFEPDTYYAAFSAELEIASSPMWALASHCKDKSTAGQTKQIIRTCIEALQDWFDAINCKDSTKAKPYQLTFHLPLHRHLAIFLVHAIQYQDVPPESVLPSERMLKTIMIHPLQIQVGVTEIYSGMWVRNGLQIKGQAMTYVQCHFCYSMVDADIYLLQVCASRLDPDYFVQTVLDRFHLQDWLTLTPSGGKSRYKLNEEHQLSMVEGALCTLCMLQSVRTNLGMDERELVRLEMATLLCVGDRTHSQLSDLMPEKSGMSGLGKELFEPTLKEISTYKAPNFEAGGGMQQGTYVPKDYLWKSDFDPLHVFLRSVHRKDFQSAMDRYTDYLRQHDLYKGKSSPWPPFRMPGPILSQYAGLRRFLHCKTLHGFIFTVLLKALKEPTCTESILYFCIYLLELAVTLPPVDATKRTTTVPDQVHDCQYIEWFPSNSISYNVRHVVKEVLVATPTADAEGSTSATVDMETSSLEEMFHLTPSVISSSAGPLTSAYTGVMPSISPAMAPLIVAPPGSGSLHLATLKQPEPIKYESKGVSTDSLESNLTPVTINESIVSLLMKLHAKFSEKKCLYVPGKQQKKRNVGDTAGSATDRGAPSEGHSRVGDAAYFIECVLDKIGGLSTECNKHLEEVYTKMCPKAEASKPATGKSPTDPEEKRRKARQRQQKLMEQFASKQKAFMEQNMDTEADLSEDAADSSSQEPKYEEKTYDCVICNQSSPSTNERPMGLVVLLQATSILGHRLQLPQPKTLPVGEGRRTAPRHTHCSEVFNNRLDKMLEHFEEAHCQMSVNIGWEGGVHVQSCGHYLHLDCHSSYVESLKSQHFSQNLNVAKGEYGCPLCRQLANSVISIVPQELSSLVRPVSHDPHQMVLDLGHLMAKRPITPGSSRLTKSMGSMMEDLTNTTYSIFKTYTKSPTSESVLLFVCSVARTNLELELLVRGGNLMLSSSVSRKASFLPLVHVLGMHSKILISGPYTELWSHLTGVILNEQASSSVQPYRVGVPYLLLKDMTSLLIQLVLTLPATIEKEHYSCLVQMLYNAVFVQSLAALTCKFTDEERAAWRTKGRNAKSSQLESLLSHVITRLECSRLYDDADMEMEHKIPAICQSVWSPQCVESSLQENCLPFLRLASLLQTHLFSEDLSTAKPKQTEFQLLTSYLHLVRQDLSGPRGSEVNYLRLCALGGERAPHIDKKLIMANKLTSLLSTNPVWHGPRLMALPHQYYKIFQHYRNKQCGGCSNVPKDPAICLVCGRYLCFKQACCSSQQQRIFECVEHSIECGAGTGIFLLVNSSVIVVVRGPRATLWGSVYLDEHGEEDRDLKRGKPLYLSEDRYHLLETQWLSHTFDHACKRWIWHQDRL
ncbi:LOW QUALITY PROTEIN: E3 ubiquitin-protein ligase ubr3-like [Liolophura sinensis]|uniref:LOW QUALITY PROTEIN: E3 ubiquitin-protein ligase ubr3-like n=1 Tax=Liolophura sinensis TaxID=3198878 RepID=UPI00315833BE